MMILLDKHTGLAVNPAEIRSIHFERSGPETWLLITMKDRFELRIKHASAQGGADVYELHRRLLEAA